MASSPPADAASSAGSAAGNSASAGDGAASGEPRAPSSSAPVRGGGNGGSSAFTQSPANAAAGTVVETAASSLSLRRPLSAGRLGPSFTSDPSLSTLPRRQQQPAVPPHHAAWGGPTGNGGAFSAGVTPTASASASAAALAASSGAFFGAGAGGAAGGRSWLKVDAEGRAAVVRVDKAHLAAELGVQARDLRLLDPHFNHSYPSAILCRDRVRIPHFFFADFSSSFFQNFSHSFSFSPSLSQLRPWSSTSSTSS